MLLETLYFEKPSALVRGAIAPVVIVRLTSVPYFLTLYPCLTAHHEMRQGN